RAHPAAGERRRVIEPVGARESRLVKLDGEAHALDPGPFESEEALLPREQVDEARDLLSLGDRRRRVRRIQRIRPLVGEAEALQLPAQEARARQRASGWRL